MMESSEKLIMIYTAQAMTVGIVKHTSLNTLSVEKLNLQLVREPSTFYNYFGWTSGISSAEATLCPTLCRACGETRWQYAEQEEGLDALRTAGSHVCRSSRGRPKVPSASESQA